MVLVVRHQEVRPLTPVEVEPSPTLGLALISHINQGLFFIHKVSDTRCLTPCGYHDLFNTFIYFSG